MVAHNFGKMAPPAIPTINKAEPTFVNLPKPWIVKGQMAGHIIALARPSKAINNTEVYPEVGFYYGCGYVSYGIGVAISVATFIAWWIIIGISYDDNRLLYWLIFNSVLIIALQPWLMRFSRTIWLALFVKYDPDWRNHPAKTPEHCGKFQSPGL